ncbi:MAG: iron complex outermembrane receptor protein [Patiriisocius sp.]|jgi:iron complex outermembrane receptor protein
MKPRNIRSCGSLIGIAVGFALASPWVSAEDEIETVTVTGSYIKGTPGDAPSPVQTLTRDDIVISGVSDVSELIRNLEIASGSDTAPQNESRFNGNSGSGLANVNLRGVGPTATLVLMDGKRLPFAGQKLADGDRFVDINSIPITMIQRVEVLKDGGSAIYGSDAIAGAVNFITRDDFEGFEVTAKYQETSEGSQDDSTIGAIFGWGSDDGNTNFVIGGEYFDRGHLESSDRRDLTNDVFPLQNETIVNSISFNGPDSQCGGAGLGVATFNNNGFGSEPNACNRNGSDTELLIPEQERSSVMANFTHVFSEAAELYGQVSWLDSRSGESRPIHVGPIEPKYALPGILNALVPFGIGSSPANDPSNILLGGSTIPDLATAQIIAPLLGLPVAAAPAIILPLDLVDYEVRVPGIDADRNYDAHNEQETTRIQLGLRGDFEIGNKAWSYDFSVTRGESEFSTHALGLDSDRLELAHYGLGGPGCTPDGGVSNLADPRVAAARGLVAGADGIIDTNASTPGSQGPLEGTIAALSGTLPGQPFINPDNVILALTSSNRGDASQGCFFFNPYLTRDSTLPNSEELLQWLEVELSPAQKSETFLTAYDLVFSGELLEMDAGMLSMAVGFQRREEGRDTFVNPKTIGAVNSFGQLSNQESVAGLSENRPFDAERDITATFFEFQIPLTEDIDVQLAGRYEDYGSDIGSTFDPKLGVRWQATESLTLRSSASTSFRGPGLAQTEEGTGFSLEFGVVDVLGEGTDAAGPNCVRTGRCGLPTGTAIPTIIIVKQGLATPQLEPETAVTYNIGGIWAPVEGPLEGLTVGLDYYNIKIEDKIIDVPTQSLLGNELVLFSAALAANEFVVAVPGQADFGAVCDPTAAEFNPGNGARAEACQVNPASYSINPTNSVFTGGNIARRTDSSRDLQIITSGALNTGQVQTDGVDANFSYIWENDLGAFAVSGRLNYIREFVVSGFPGGQPDFDAAGFTNNDPNRRLTQSMPDLKGNLGLSYLRDRHTARLNMRFVGEYEDNASINNRIGDGDIDSYYAFDFNYTYTVPVNDSELVFTLGAIDLFEADLPELKNANGTDLLVFDPRGRRVYGAVKFML